MTSPLAGLNVIETPGSVATRYCGRLFARHGATVTQVGTVPTTGFGYGGAASEAYASWLDHGKQSALDLPSAIAATEGRIDLIIAGLDAASIVAVDAASLPDTIRVAMTWFAADGPYADWTGSDAVIQAMSGVAYSTGAIDGAPMLPRGHAPQVIAGTTAFIAGLSAVIGRDAGWAGRRIALNVLEANLCFMEGSVATDSTGSPRVDRHGVNRFKTMFPVGIYRTSDGWIGVTANSPAQWVDLCSMIGLPDLAKDERLTLTVQRVAYADELYPVLAEAFLKKPSDAWLIEGQRRRVPLAPVPDLAALVELPHWQGRGSFASVPGHAAATGPTLPFSIETLSPVEGGEGPIRQKAARPLSGVRILDLSMGWSGPLATRHLGDLGAEVVKVESCVHLDWWRGFYTDIAIDPPPYETRPNFLMVNRNKLGVTLDLKSEAGRNLVLALARVSDVMIENYAPGALDKLGLDARTMIDAKPDLAYVSMGAFGATGPWRGFRGYGTTVEQASGLPFVNGEPDDPPTMQHAAYGDPVAGLFGAVACLIALYDHARRKRGAIIDLGQVEGLFQLGADAIIAQSLQQTLLARDGSRHPLAALRSVCPTKAAKKWIAVTVETPMQWNALSEVIGRSDFAVGDGTFEEAKRREHSLEVALLEWCAQRDGTEAVSTLQAAGVSAGPVHATLDLLDDPQLVQVGFWRTTDRAFSGKHLAPLTPYTLDGERPPVTHPTPTLGQHNVEVLGGILGLSSADIERLAGDGVIGTSARAK